MRARQSAEPAASSPAASVRARLTPHSAVSFVWPEATAALASARGGRTSAARCARSFSLRNHRRECRKRPFKVHGEFAVLSRAVYAFCLRTWYDAPRRGRLRRRRWKPRPRAVPGPKRQHCRERRQSATRRRVPCPAWPGQGPCARASAGRGRGSRARCLSMCRWGPHLAETDEHPAGGSAACSTVGTKLQ